jgi:hypothetical protein
MPGLLVESNVGAVWVGRQTAKGTPSVVAGKKCRMVGGSMPQTNTAYGNENFMDGNRFQNATDFVDTIQGGGAPAIQAQSGVFAYLCYLFCGQESFATATHTITPASGSFWTTWWKSLGATTVMRERYEDCRITQLVIEGSTGQKVLRVTPTILSLNPGRITNADPVKADDATEALNYNQAQGTFTIDGTVVTGHSAFTITCSDDLQPYRGDSPFAMALAPGRGTIGLNATILLDDQGLAQFYKIYYGNTNPSSGSLPVTSVPALGTYEFTATLSASESIKIKFYGVRWSPPDAPDGNPDGGAITLGLTGGGRLVASNPMIEFTVKNADPTYVGGA